MKRLLIFLAAALIAVSATAQTPSGEDVLRRVDDNLVYDQAKSTSTMIIHGRSGTRTITSGSWSTGRDSSLVEYLSPPQGAGKEDAPPGR